MAVLSVFILLIERATEERSYERFLVFSQAKNKYFYKNTQNQRAKLIVSKNDKSLLFDGGLFQQVSLTWNENLYERIKKIEVEDRIQKTDGEEEETFLDFLAQYEVYEYLKKWWWIW